MKAIIHDRYGPIESLERREIDPPTIGDHEVLVRVHAAAVTSVTSSRSRDVRCSFEPRPACGGRSTVSLAST